MKSLPSFLSNFGQTQLILYFQHRLNCLAPRKQQFSFDLWSLIGKEWSGGFSIQKWRTGGFAVHREQRDEAERQGVCSVGKKAPLWFLGLASSVMGSSRFLAPLLLLSHLSFSSFFLLLSIFFVFPSLSIPSIMPWFYGDVMVAFFNTKNLSLFLASLTVDFLAVSAKEGIICARKTETLVLLYHELWLSSRR